MELVFPENYSVSAHLVATNPEESLAVAYRRIVRGHFRHLPVISKVSKLVGIISDRDFQRAMWPCNLFDAHGYPEGPLFGRNAKVADFMSSPVISLSDDSNLLLAVQTMIKKKISSLVVTTGQEVAGIITHEDLLKILEKLLLERDFATQQNSDGVLDSNSPLHRVSDILAKGLINFSANLGH